MKPVSPPPKTVRWRIPVLASITLAALATLGLAIWLAWMEAPPVTVVFVLGVTGAMLGLICIATRRPLFAVATSIVVVVAIDQISRLKRAVDGMVFHAWDLIQVFSWNDTSDAIRAWPRVWLICAMAFVAVAVILTFLARAEPPTLRRDVAALFVAGCCGLVAWSAPRLQERGHTQYFWDGLYVSAFYRSFGETAEAVWRGGLFELGARAGAALTQDDECRAESAPHILLIHEESVTPPSGFPGLAYDKSLDDFFRSQDGSSRKLRVETYGGASWLTQFSVLAGVSSRAFGRMSSFVQPFMTGRLGESVPQVLVKCGYRNMMFTAWPKQFMAIDRFYGSIGIKQIFDQKAQGNINENERDRFFFGNVLTQIESHVAASRAPLFAFIETMSAHWPYDFTYEPGVVVPGGGPGVHPEVHEYLRRLALVKMDDEWLKSELARRFPAEAFLIVRYGDHHPHATRTLIGLPESIEVESIHLPDESPGFITFYATGGVGYRPPPTPDLETIDAAYVGGVLLEAARLPLPASWRERLELMRACGGRYWTCPDHDRILSFQRRLADGGLMRRR